MATAKKRSLPRRMIRIILKAILWFVGLSLLWVLVYKFVPPPFTFTMMGDVLSGRSVSKDWMSLDEIDSDMTRAAIAAEDSKFCTHHGFDVDAIAQAMERNARGGRIRGGSTISQQTAKNAFLWQGGGFFRKGLEAWFTLLIEQIWGKQRIMEVYLNIAETGIATYGANAGAMRYFDHDASRLSATEASRIAAVLPLPKKRGAVAPRGYTRRYGNSIASRMRVVRNEGMDACIRGDGPAPTDRDDTEASERPKRKAARPTQREAPAEESPEQPEPSPTPEPGSAPPLPLPEETPIYPEPLLPNATD